MAVSFNQKIEKASLKKICARERRRKEKRNLQRGMHSRLGMLLSILLALESDLTD